MSSTVISALSVDELRAVSRLTGMALAPMLQEEPADEPDSPLRDVVAMRSLLARGLAWLAQDDDGVRQPAVAPGCNRALAPLANPDAIVEVELEVGDELLRHVLAQGDGELLHLAERDPDVWALIDDGCGLHDLLRAMVSGHVDGCAAARGRRLELPTEAHLRVDALLLEGFEDQVEPELVASGVPTATAGAWAVALRERRGAGAVRVAHRRAGGVLAGGDVRWVAAGEHGLWLVEEGEPGDHDEDGSAGTTVLRDVTADGVLAAVAALFDSDDARRGHQ
jgi:hypothetical protein